MTSTAPDDCRAGQEALARAAWPDARAAFTDALARRESPEALEGLGLAAWWLDLADVMFDARERAFRLYRDRGDQAAAARVAVWLAWDYWAFRGESAVASGWLQRARRLLEHGPPSAERAWLEVREGSLCLYEDYDPDRAHALASEGVRIAREAGSTDMELLGRAVQGLALVMSGAVAEGMRASRRSQRRRGRRRDARLRRDRAVLLLPGRRLRARARLRSRGSVVHPAAGVLREVRACGRSSPSAARSTPRSACGAGPGSRPSSSCPPRRKSSSRAGRR